MQNTNSEDNQRQPEIEKEEERRGRMLAGLGLGGVTLLFAGAGVMAAAGFGALGFGLAAAVAFPMMAVGFGGTYVAVKQGMRDSSEADVTTQSKTQHNKALESFVALNQGQSVKGLWRQFDGTTQSLMQNSDRSNGQGRG